MRSDTVPAVSHATVDQVVELILQLNGSERAELLRRLPHLRPTTSRAGKTAPRTEPWTPGDLETAAADVQRQLDQLADTPALSADAPFLAGMTVAEFFSQPEAIQRRIWETAHAEAEQALGENREYATRPDAVPAR